MTNLLESDPRVLAEAWLAVDPDPVTKAETEQLLSGDDQDLIDRFGTRLTFGTAGLRGPLGAGPARMNRVLVRVVAAALAAYVADEANGADSSDGDIPHIVVGYDARHLSRAFAEDTVAVVAAQGLRCTLFPGIVPTPILAFAVRQLNASAGVMVTASHNPRADNGYKIYWHDGAQIAAPHDAAISARIEQMPLLGDTDLVALDHPLISIADDSLVPNYLDAVVGLLTPDGARSARVAYTPLHGVAARFIDLAFIQAGFSKPVAVAEQVEPDPDFPTTPMPNPEESGVLEPLLALATEIEADVALANDPDGDRLAVVVPNGPSWRLLSGDEVGSILAEYLLSSSDPAGRPKLVANTVVSSRLLSSIAAHYGAEHVETLTGFKWLMQAGDDRPDHDYLLGYEEALGYAIGSVVRDKDGISGALVVAELVGELGREGRGLLDLLDGIHVRHGMHVTGQRAIRFESTSEDTPVMAAAMDALRALPPSEVGGLEVLSVTDLAEGSQALPATEALVLNLDGGRIVVRPSGTEAKLKLYGEIMAPPSADPAQASVEARMALNAVLDDAVALTARPERRAGSEADPSADSLVAERAAAMIATLPTGASRAADLRLIARCVELTALAGNDTRGTIRTLCAQARRPDPADATVGPSAAVCVHPQLVGLAKELSGGSGVRVATVAGGFPLTLAASAVRLADIGSAAESGADEVDVVLNRSAFLDGRFDDVRDELAASRAEAGATYFKVILEVGELGSTDAVRRACELAVEAGADMIETSTGTAAAGATPAAVLVLAECLADHYDSTGRAVGLKVAGGVRTAEEALGYLGIARAVLGDRWMTPDLFRIGASSLLSDLLSELVATERHLRDRA